MPTAILAALDASHDAAARGWSELATDLLTYAYRLALELLRALVRGDAMVAAASAYAARTRASRSSSPSDSPAGGSST